LDGWPNRDLNVGAIIALASDLTAFEKALDTDTATIRQILMSWGPGKFDAELVLDGQAINPNTGMSAATLIPPAFGLAGVNLHTWTGWGSVTHWNAFVGVLGFQHFQQLAANSNLRPAASGRSRRERFFGLPHFLPCARARYTEQVGVPVEQWRQVEKLYHAALERPPSQREAFLADAAEDEEVRREVASLLAQDPSDELLGEPAWKAAIGTTGVTQTGDGGTKPQRMGVPLPSWRDHQQSLPHYSPRRQRRHG
jgi:hypothetical protein